MNQECQQQTNELDFQAIYSEGIITVPVYIEKDDRGFLITQSNTDSHVCSVDILTLSDIYEYATSYGTRTQDMAHLPILYRVSVDDDKPRLKCIVVSEGGARSDYDSLPVSSLQEANAFVMQPHIASFIHLLTFSEEVADVLSA